MASYLPTHTRVPQSFKKNFHHEARLGKKYIFQNFKTLQVKKNDLFLMFVGAQKSLSLNNERLRDDLRFIPQIYRDG